MPAIYRATSVETRAAERFVPHWTATVLLTKKGSCLNGRIINISSLGVAIEADFSQNAPDLVVKVGKRRVKPGRKIMGGSVFLFDPPIPNRHCTESIVL